MVTGVVGGGGRRAIGARSVIRDNEIVNETANARAPPELLVRPETGRLVNPTTDEPNGATVEIAVRCKVRAYMAGGYGEGRKRSGGPRVEDGRTDRAGRGRKLRDRVMFSN